jgi:ribulose-5-phosphate 4-epimerase/fuculose-1-phosphate aldolase
MNETETRAAIVRWGRSLFERGLTGGSSGNISARVGDGYIVTPTNACLGFLDADRLSRLDADGGPLDGDPPTKEIPLHLAFYRNRPTAGAVVHLHSTFATALSCLAETDPEDAIPPLTPYVVMRVGRVPLVPYTRPGSPEVAPLVAARAEAHAAVLLRNHGPVVAAATLDAAVYAIEELEEAAKLALLTRGMGARPLDRDQVADLERAFRLR